MSTTTDASLAGRIAIVTGASAGIGAACARDLAARGASVVINARRGDRIQELADDVNAQAGAERVATAPGDAADDHTIDRLFGVATDRFGEPDLVVVNAGRGLSGSVLTSDPGEWAEMIRVNLLGAAKLMRTAGARMADAADAEKDAWDAGARARVGGEPVASDGLRARDLVVLGSTVGRHISPFSSMYGSTKFGVNSLAEALRREIGPRGVRVTLVEPGIVVSEFQQVAGYDAGNFNDLMTKFGPVLRPEDVAETIAYACALPPWVHVNDIVIRGTRQEYP
jgi:NADP-dependent 3-hydroxy acid dehydrogenase YdfG